MNDLLGRPLRDLRISVTDRCNLRCAYCMPSEVFGKDYEFLRRSQLLTFEEVVRLAGILVDLGVRKIRITGGEPLLRRELPLLIGQLTELPGLEDLTLTTNGLLLANQARELKQAGLRRVTVSLDALDSQVFGQINGRGVKIENVLKGIEAASQAGLHPIKVNCVVQRSLNRDQVLPMARYFHGSGHILRFIEYMDVGNTNGWNLDEVVPAAEILSLIAQEMDLDPLEPNYRGEVARRWRYRDGGGEIGIIASVTQPFCPECTRARLSPEGSLYTCLFAASGLNLRDPMRQGLSDAQLRELIEQCWKGRQDRYSEIRSSATKKQKKVEMSFIGG